MPPKPTKQQRRAKGKAAAKGADAPAAAAEDAAPVVISDRTCTGVYTLPSGSRDIKIEGFTLTARGTVLIQDSVIELNFGNRYGLIGRNGSGKSTFLKSLAAKEVPIPDHMDVYLLENECEPTELTALEAVIDHAKKEHKRLEEKEEELITTVGPDHPLVMDLYDRLDALDPATFEKRAGELLSGLGFDSKSQHKKTKDMSGGWRMRVALATALFIRPTLLLLDEPTNHLDLEACVWLEEYLKTYTRILVMVSHSQDFLNGVTTHTMYLNHKRQIQYYGGNYDTYVKTRSENEVNQMKQYAKQQEEIKHIKDFIASCGTYANLVRQAKSRQKILDKMIADGLIEPVEREQSVNLAFPSCGKLAPPVMAFTQVAFAYNGNMADALYKNLEFGIDLDSRIALVGPNGAGKSTLLKLMVGELRPTDGMVQRHNHLRIARYHQHSAEIMDENLTPLEFMQSEFQEMNRELTEWRQQLGRFGITGKIQTTKIGMLSDGEKTRIIFCWLAQKTPHLLLFDEPTNHLDMEGIDGLAKAINEFEGGMVLVSHDFRLVEQVAKEIWVCDNKKVTKWQGGIKGYKSHLKSRMKL
eukprot:comp12876_c1_seq1/m.8057 comp12876_c1_seq1/g.8057  ORF comp12876_c1_seq1/g.8057 comp12876_c1_seq1/m.8057 type:complete len:584 (-) comp12876_c1_seq1:185-1936(-)